MAATNFILARHSRELEINRVILNPNLTEGFSLDDWEDGCNLHGLCSNFTCYCYQEYSGDQWEKLVDDIEDGVKYYIVGAICGVVLLVAFGVNWMMNGLGYDLKDNREESIGSNNDE